METESVLRVICALVLVLSLFGLCSILYKKYLLDKNFMNGGKAKRLSIEEQLYLDSKHRLVLVKKDDAEFLLLLGPNGEMLINAKTNSKEQPVDMTKSTRVKTNLRLKRIKNIYPRKKS